RLSTGPAGQRSVTSLTPISGRYTTAIWAVLPARRGPADWTRAGTVGGPDRHRAGPCDRAAAGVEVDDEPGPAPPRGRRRAAAGAPPAARPGHRADGPRGARPRLRPARPRRRLAAFPRRAVRGRRHRRGAGRHGDAVRAAAGRAG